MGTLIVVVPMAGKTCTGYRYFVDQEELCGVDQGVNPTMCRKRRAYYMGGEEYGTQSGLEYESCWAGKSLYLYYVGREVYAE
jgi:hypothetical protein